MLISAADKYDVPLCHVVPTFVAFMMRREPLTEVEAALLSLGTVVRLAHARENLLRNTPTNKPLSVGYPEQMARRIVYDIWPEARDLLTSCAMKSV